MRSESERRSSNSRAGLDLLVVLGKIEDVVEHEGYNFFPQDVEHTAERCHTLLAPNSWYIFC